MNNLLLILLSVSFTASIALNIYLFLKTKSQKKTRPQSVELQEFLADLLSGPAIVAVGRIDPNSILMRSPKK